MVDPAYHHQPLTQTHSAEIHAQPRPMHTQRHPAEPERQGRDHRHQRARSLPNSKPSKHSDPKNKEKDKSKHNTPTKSSKHKEKERNTTKPLPNNLPDFIPIHHVNVNPPPQHHAPPPANYNQYEYGQYNARITQSHVQPSYQGRPRPGVGVVFNPDIGVTDF